MTDETPVTFEPLPVEVLLAQGACCGSQCYHCPYVDEAGQRWHKGETRVELKISHTEKYQRKMSK